MTEGDPAKTSSISSCETPCLPHATSPSRSKRQSQMACVLKFRRVSASPFRWLSPTRQTAMTPCQHRRQDTLHAHHRRMWSWGLATLFPYSPRGPSAPPSGILPNTTGKRYRIRYRLWYHASSSRHKRARRRSCQRTRCFQASIACRASGSIGDLCISFTVARI